MSFTTIRWKAGDPVPEWQKKSIEAHKKRWPSKIVPLKVKRPNSRLSVYVLRSRKAPELVKIGITIKPVIERLKNINKEDHYYRSLDFEIELKFKGGGQVAEHMAHYMLKRLGRHVKVRCLFALQKRYEFSLRIT